MGIQTANKNDEILLLKTNLTEFQNIKMEKLQKWIEMYGLLPNKRFKSIDEFRMPNLNFDFMRRIDEMRGLSFTNPNRNQTSL